MTLQTSSRSDHQQPPLQLRALYTHDTQTHRVSVKGTASHSGKEFIFFMFMFLRSCLLCVSVTEDYRRLSQTPETNTTEAQETSHSLRTHSQLKVHLLSSSWALSLIWSCRFTHLNTHWWRPLPPLVREPWIIVQMTGTVSFHWTLDCYLYLILCVVLL